MASIEHPAIVVCKHNQLEFKLLNSAMCRGYFHVELKKKPSDSDMNLWLVSNKFFGGRKWQVKLQFPP